MQLTVDGLAQRLEAELGVDVVKREPSLLALHQIDGHTATLLCLPATPEQVATTLCVCSEANAAVVPWSGGTAIRIGNLPRRVDVDIGGYRLAIVHGGVQRINQFVFASTAAAIKHGELDKAGVDGVIASDVIAALPRVRAD